MILLVDSEGPDHLSDCADVQTDLGLCCLHMPKDTFLHGVAHKYEQSFSIPRTMDVLKYSSEYLLSCSPVL